MSIYRGNVEFEITNTITERRPNGFTMITAKPIVDDGEFCKIIEINIKNRDATRYNIKKRLVEKYWEEYIREIGLLGNHLQGNSIKVGDII